MNRLKNFPIIFDTLAYSQNLREEGVAHAETHATCLARALAQNIYTKNEVNHMFEDALKEFNQSTREMKKQFERSLAKIEAKAKADAAKWETKNAKLRTEMVKMCNRSTTISISVLGSLMIFIGTLSTLSSYFIHR